MLRSVAAAVAGFEEPVVAVDVAVAAVAVAAAVVAAAAAAVVVAAAVAATTWLSVVLVLVLVPAAKLRSNPATRHLVADAVVAVALVRVSRAISIDLGECW